jgi:uncharacterized membrane protein YphA (DoxX/SURF4 family)
MNTLLWIVQLVLAVVFAAAGIAKIALPRPRLRTTLGDWVDAFPAPMIKLLGVAEVAAGVGLTVSLRTGIAPVLAPPAAFGVIAVMVGAIITHGRRREYPNVAVNVMLAVAAGIVIWGRLGPHGF